MSCKLCNGSDTTTSTDAGTCDNEFSNGKKILSLSYFSPTDHKFQEIYFYQNTKGKKKLALVWYFSNNTRKTTSSYSIALIYTISSL